jgi:hypothetical protein
MSVRKIETRTTQSQVIPEERERELRPLYSIIPRYFQTLRNFFPAVESKSTRVLLSMDVSVSDGETCCTELGASP